MNRWELEQKIVIRALKDPTFRKQLIAQPKETVREFLKNEKGIDSSRLDRLNVRVVEEQKNEWVLALPDITLSDAELQKLVAAGDTWDFIVNIIHGNV